MVCGCCKPGFGVEFRRSGVVWDDWGVSPFFLGLAFLFAEPSNATGGVVCVMLGMGEG